MNPACFCLSFSSALLLTAGSAGAHEHDATLSVGATVVGSCAVTAANAGTEPPPDALDAVFTLTLKCAKGTDYSVALSAAVGDANGIRASETGVEATLLGAAPAAPPVKAAAAAGVLEPPALTETLTAHGRLHADTGMRESPNTIVVTIRY